MDLRVRQYAKFHELASPPNAFSRLVLSNILEITDQDAVDCITDGGNDRGVDAVYISESQKTIYLFQFKHCEKYEKSSKYFPGEAVDKIASVFPFFECESPDEEKQLNPALLRKVRAIRSCLQEELYHFQIVLCSNASPMAETELSRLQKLVSPYNYVDVKCIHCRELARLFAAPRIQAEMRSLRYESNQIFERSDGNKRGLTCSANLGALVDFLRDPKNPVLIDDNLFRQNVRLHLGSDNTVNHSIKSTLLGTQSPDFWYLNNGITIVCERFEYQPKMTSPIRLKNPQIVNGCQTANQIFSASLLNDVDLDGVAVSVRIIETADFQLVGRIAEATNSQTAIRGRDLRANDEVQQKIEAGMAELGFYYERKRNQHPNSPMDKTIDALRAGQAILAYYLSKPDKSKTATDKIFDEFYREVFDPNRFTAQDILIAVQLLNMIEVRKEMAKREMTSVTRHFFQEEWLVEGSFHVLYVLGLLADRSMIPRTSVESVSALLDEAIKEVGDFFKSQRNAAAYRVFRSAVTAEKLRTAIDPAHPVQLKLAI